MIDIREARPSEAAELAEIHIAARRQAMPWLTEPGTPDEVRAWFGRAVGIVAGEWWLAQDRGPILGFMQLSGHELDHLYIRPEAQGRGIGSALLIQAKAFSPTRLELWTFQRNAAARRFYEGRGFRPDRFTDGDNMEGEPDVHYIWEGLQ